jgi:hypothetical protein
VKAGDAGTIDLELYLSKSELLLADFGWKRHSRELLASWPEEVPLLPLVAEAMEGFEQIEQVVLHLLMKRCAVFIESMRHGILRVKSIITRGHPAVFQLPSKRNRGFLWQTFPPLSSLRQLEFALQQPDPVAAVRRPPEQATVHRPGQAHAENQAAAVLGVWLEYGPGAELTAAVNRVIDDDQEITPLVSGLVNISAQLLEMLSQSLGTSSKALLGGFVYQEPQDEE